MPPLDHAESSISQAGARHSEAHGINGAREEAFSRQSESGCATQDSPMNSDSVQNLLPSLEIEGMQDGKASTQSTGEKSGDSTSKSTAEKSGESYGEKNSRSTEKSGSDSDFDSEKCGEDKSGKSGDSKAENPEESNGAAGNGGEQGEEIQPEIKNDLNEAQTSDREEKVKKLETHNTKDPSPVQEDFSPGRGAGTVERPASSIPQVINENQKKK